MDVLFYGPNTADQAQGFIRGKEALRLNLDIWPITVDVYFDEDPDPNQTDEFAITNTIAGDHYELRFRNDAPHFQNGPSHMHFDVAKFYRETVAHELGHVLTFALNEEALTLVSRLFGAEPTPESLYPIDKVWADRPGEAIAETFKDAFMPQGQREWANRTNIQLKYPYFPLFRAIYRNAVTEDMLRSAEDMLGLPSGDLGDVPSSSVGGSGVTEGDDTLAFGGNGGGGLHTGGATEGISEYRAFSEYLPGFPESIPVDLAPGSLLQAGNGIWFPTPEYFAPPGAGFQFTVHVTEQQPGMNHGIDIISEYSMVHTGAGVDGWPGSDPSFEVMGGFAFALAKTTLRRSWAVDGLIFFHEDFAIEPGELDNTYGHIVGFALDQAQSLPGYAGEAYTYDPGSDVAVMTFGSYAIWEGDYASQGIPQPPPTFFYPRPDLHPIVDGPGLGIPMFRIVAGEEGFEIGQDIRATGEVTAGDAVTSRRRSPRRVSGARISS